MASEATPTGFSAATGHADTILSRAPFVTIQAGSSGLWNLVELWRDREILAAMIWRDISVRYKETAIGFLWVVLQPLMLMLILSFFFRQLGEVPQNSVPVHVRIFSSLLIWDFIAMSLERAGVSLLNNVGIISKLYFCRLILPLTPIGASVFDFLIKLVLLGVLMALNGVAPTWNIVFVPLILACVLLFAVSVCIWLSAVTAFYKDVALTIPFVLRAFFFLSPVFYESTQLIAPQYQYVYHFNPFAALIESFNYVLLGTDTLPVAGLLTTVAGSLVLLGTGTTFFRYVETSIVDVI